MSDYNESWKWERTDLECYNPKTKKYDLPSKSAWLISPSGKRWEIMDVSDEEMNRIVLCVNACAGLSDEDVERFANGTMDCKDCINATTALQAELAEAIETRDLAVQLSVKLGYQMKEAVELLEYVQKMSILDDNIEDEYRGCLQEIFATCDAFLAKHKGE